VPAYLNAGDPVNSLGAAAALPVFLFLAYHEDLSYRWNEEFQPLRFLATGAFWAAGIYFVVDRIPAISSGLIDVVAGSSDGDVFWWRNLPPTSWGSRNTIVDMAVADDVLTLRVGDVDGDYIDDVMVGTATGYIRWLRHLTTGAWDNRIILSISTALHIDIGDVDRGVLINLALNQNA